MQSEIIDLLEKVKKPLTTREIAGLLEASINNIKKDIRKLLDYNEIKFCQVDKDIALKFFNSKRRLRIFYLRKEDLKEVKEMLAYNR